MRLTEKDYCGYDIKDRKNFNGYNEQQDCEKLFSAIQKLGQLEDIEEELGIDLITLFKAQTQGFYIINVFNVIEKVKLSEWRFNLIKKEVHKVKNSKHLLFTDYGKTWALTKEELL